MRDRYEVQTYKIAVAEVGAGGSFIHEASMFVRCQIKWKGVHD